MKNPKKSGYKPGQQVPYSGEWRIVGPRGGAGDERTLPKGSTFPATPKSGSTFSLSRAARNGSGR